MNNWKSTIYCYARLNLWFAFYIIITIPILWVVSELILLIDTNKLLSVFFEDSIDNLELALAGGMPIFFSQKAHVFIVSLAFLTGIVLHKPALNRMIFKKYNKIELIPQIKKITWKFTAVFWTKIFVAISIISIIEDFVLASIYMKDVNPFQFATNTMVVSNSASAYSKFSIGYLACGLVSFVLNIIITFIITKLTLDKYTTISKNNHNLSIKDN